jgi:glycosyltransferase involved in cell wall biosynthesis
VIGGAALVMKILHLSTNDQGGAGRAAYRLHQGLLELGIHSAMLVQTKSSDDRTVSGPERILPRVVAELRPGIERIPTLFYKRRRSGIFFVNWLPRMNPVSVIKQQEPDIVHLHWVSGGFLPMWSFSRLPRPIVWHLHDSWAFTGGCHIPYECSRYTHKCGECPHLGSQSRYDLSRLGWSLKNRAYSQVNLTIVTPSHWLADCVRKSSLLGDRPVFTIPNGLDVSIYRPVAQDVARELLDLPADKKLILFGALSALEDEKKGGDLLIEALQHLNRVISPAQCEVVIFGAERPPRPLPIPFEAHYLGRLYDDLVLALAYSAADVMVVPSRQEAFGQTASEAMACGTPVVAFETSGLKDIVDHQQNGYLAEPYNTHELAKGIAWVLADRARRINLSKSARDKAVDRFAVEKVAQQYIKLYADIFSKR